MSVLLGSAAKSMAPTMITPGPDRKSTRLNSSHSQISYAVFCLKKKSAAIEPAAAFRVFALVVLAPDIKIDVARSTVAQRRLDPGEEPHRTEVDVLVEAAPQRDQ